MSSQADEWPLTNLPSVGAGCPCPHPGHLRTCQFYRSGAPSPAYGEPWSAASYWAPSGMDWMAIEAWNGDQHLFSLEDRELAERIVACVNACAGIANPAALGALLDELQSSIYDNGWIPTDSRLAEAFAALDVGQEEGLLR